MTQRLTAAELVSDPSRIREADPIQLPALLSQISAVTAAVAARLGILCVQRSADDADRLLKADEAASILNVSKDWLYKSDAAKLFRVRVAEGVVRFSHLGVQRFIERSRGR
jgi:hypothetical protein